MLPESNLSWSFANTLEGTFPVSSCRHLLVQGGGVYINGATVTFFNTQIHDNVAEGVRSA
jgi:hypothetical protein